MTPEEKSLLERTYALAEENNHMLKSIRRASRFALIFRVAYWAVIILLSVGAFYFIQPYISTLFNVYGSLLNSSSEFKGLFNGQ